MAKKELNEGIQKVFNRTSVSLEPTITKKVGVLISPEMKKEFDLLKVESGKSLNDLFVEAFTLYLTEQKKKKK